VPSSIYDDPEINTGEDDFPDDVKFALPGDRVRARILTIEKIKTKFGPTLKYMVGNIELLVQNGREVATDWRDQKSMLAGSKNLKASMLEKKPDPGDLIDLTYTELRPTQSGGDVKIFVLEVEPAQMAPRAPAAQPAPEPVQRNEPTTRAAQAERAPDPGRAPVPRAVQTIDDERDIFDE
jgi:hypothetical protein